MGDLNVNYLKQKDNIDIKNVLTNNGLTQIVNKPTRTTKDSSALIYIIATNNVKNINIVDVIPLSLSDHDMVICVRKLNHFKHKPKYKIVRDYSNYNHINLINDLKLIDWQPILQIVDVNEALNLFK